MVVTGLVLSQFDQFDAIGRRAYAEFRALIIFENDQCGTTSRTDFVFKF
jgi:hypothetical protein